MYRNYQYDIAPSYKTKNLFLAEAWSENSDQIIFGEGKSYAEAEEDIKRNIDQYLEMYG